MSFIILALMAVFNGTQTAFRQHTQSDVLEGGRRPCSMIKSDLEAMAPSFGVQRAVNFYANILIFIPVSLGLPRR